MLRLRLSSLRTIALLLFACSILAIAQPVRDVVSQAPVIPHSPTPAFCRGYEYFIESSNRVTLYFPDGTFATSFSIEGSNGITPNVEGVAVDSDGTFAVGWGAQSLSGKAFSAGIEFLDTRGTVVRSITTGAYLPAHLTFAQDHSLWSFGIQREASDPRKVAMDYLTVRHYASDGKEIGAYLPRSLFPPGLEPGMQHWQESRISVSGDRIGLWANSGPASAMEWVELSLDGNLIGRWGVGVFQGLSAALTTDSHVYIQRWESEARAYELFTLDRAASAWQAVSLPVANGEYLIGADGDRLVFRYTGDRQNHVRWFNQPANSK
jgi:hypothetical protein